MDDEKISEEFFDNLQPLNNHFTDAFYEKSENSFLMEDLSLVTDRYDDGGQIGSGGMKQISSTTDAMTLRQVAKAKLKKQDYSSEERFIKEARLTASLEHPNIIPIYDLGLEKGEPFFTMKLIEGENLSDLISKMKNQGVNFSLQDLMQIFLKICDAVAYAHSKKSHSPRYKTIKYPLEPVWRSYSLRLGLSQDNWRCRNSGGYSFT